MKKPNVGSFASTLRLIVSFQIQTLETALRQGAKVTFSQIDRRRRPKPLAELTRTDDPQSGTTSVDPR